MMVQLFYQRRLLCLMNDIGRQETEEIVYFLYGPDPTCFFQGVIEMLELLNQSRHTLNICLSKIEFIPR